MRHHFQILLAALAALLLPLDGHAWSNAGHQLIALVAYDQLTPAETTAVLALLREHPRAGEDFRVPGPVQGTEWEGTWYFGRTAEWPDIARSQPQYHRGTWHYVNFPVWLDAETEVQFGGAAPSNMGLTWDASLSDGALNGPQALDKARQVLQSATAAPTEKALYLSWVFHLVGDLHQPLHTTALYSRALFPNGDQGGNLLKQGGDDSLSLHALWDRLLEGTQPEDGYIEALSARVAAWREADWMGVAPPSGDLSIDVRDWITEGRALAMEKVYTPPILARVRYLEGRLSPTPGRQHAAWHVPMGEAYQQAARAVAERRAILAGLRLARLLRAWVLDTEPHPPLPAPASGAAYNHDRWETQPRDLLYPFAAFVSSFDSADDNNGDGDSDIWGIPEWVAFHIKGGAADHPADRPSRWTTDPGLFDAGIAPDDATYGVSGTAAMREVKTDYRFVRGHMCPKDTAERVSAAAAVETHTVLNACPQLQWQNNGIWRDLEERCIEWADEFGAVWVVCGPVFFGREPALWLGQEGETKAAVPDALYKIVIRDAPVQALAFLIPNILPKTENDDLDAFLTSIDRIESLTGLDFLTALPDTAEETIESANYLAVPW